MKTAVKLTLDGLVRALRVRAHDLADAAERDYRPGLRPPAGGTKPTAPGKQPKASKEPADDLPGR
jgi:hypothetical protein